MDQVTSEQTIAVSGQRMRAVPLTGRREWSDVLQVSYVDRKYRDRPTQVDINDIYKNKVWQGLVDPTTNTTHEWQHIAGTWQPNDPASILQPGAFANNAGLVSVRGFVPNSLTGSADTRDRMWQTDQARTATSWDAPWKLRVSSSFTAQSGTPTGSITTNLASPELTLWSFHHVD